MNVLMLLKHKDNLAFLYEHNTIRQGLEKMRAHSYTALPVIAADGKYIGTVSEGDFLRHILEIREGDIRAQEKYCVKNILRPDFNPAVRIDVSMEELLNRAMQQNFIPVTDDRDAFIGIVTRQDIIKQFIEKKDEG